MLGHCVIVLISLWLSCCFSALWPPCCFSACDPPCRRRHARGVACLLRGAGVRRGRAWRAGLGRALPPRPERSMAWEWEVCVVVARCFACTTAGRSRVCQRCGCVLQWSCTCRFASSGAELTPGILLCGCVRKRGKTGHTAWSRAVACCSCFGSFLMSMMSREASKKGQSEARKRKAREARGEEHGRKAARDGRVLVVSGSDNHSERAFPAV